MTGARGGERRVPRRAAWDGRGTALTKVGTPAVRGPVETGDAVPVGTHGDDPGTVRGVGAGVEQRLQVGAGPGDEHHEPSGLTRHAPGPHRLVGPLGGRAAPAACTEVARSKYAAEVPGQHTRGSDPMQPGYPPSGQDPYGQPYTDPAGQSQYSMPGQGNQPPYGSAPRSRARRSATTRHRVTFAPDYSRQPRRTSSQPQPTSYETEPQYRPAGLPTISRPATRSRSTLIRTHSRVSGAAVPGVRPEQPVSGVRRHVRGLPAGRIPGAGLRSTEPGLGERARASSRWCSASCPSRSAVAASSVWSCRSRRSSAVCWVSGRPARVRRTTRASRSPA